MTKAVVRKRYTAYMCVCELNVNSVFGHRNKLLGGLIVSEILLFIID